MSERNGSFDYSHILKPGLSYEEYTESALTPEQFEGIREEIVRDTVISLMRILHERATWCDPPPRSQGGYDEYRSTLINNQKFEDLPSPLQQRVIATQWRVTGDALEFLEPEGDYA